MSDFELLAKSEPSLSLRQHIEDCMRIEEQLKDCFHNLPVDSHWLWHVVREAVCFHDMGKSHKEFQKLLYKRPNKWNGRRHELFSLPFVLCSDIPDKDKPLVLFTVAGHHKDLDELNNIVQREYFSPFPDDDTNRSFVSDCRELLVNKAWKILAMQGFSKESDASINILEVIRDISQESVPFSTEYIQRLLTVGFLKQCDHLASAGITKLHKLDSPVFSFLHTLQLYGHQYRASLTVGNTFLKAPTGTGKTETSMLWLEKQLNTSGQGRAFYVLPYTASINAMYERLTDRMGEDAVGMLHGKLIQYFDSKIDEQDGTIDVDTIRNEYQTIVRPLKIVTPFQLLKTLFGLKHFEKGIVEWAGAYFIFDEIHAYDPKTLAQIVVLMEFCTKLMNVNTFVMTATMPTHILRLLENAVGRHCTITADDDLYPLFDRHTIVMEDGLLADSLHTIQADVDKGMHVLVVCNTVEQAQHVFSKLNCGSKLLLHGAFNATDRSKKEQKLRSNDIQLLVGTQAIEVSLDIDYDTIYTEPAPLDALIQRFGRVNRRRKKGLCKCHVFRCQNKNDHFIYDADVVNRTLEVLADIDNGILHESDVQALIDRVYPCFNERQQQDYEMTYQSLTAGIKSRLHPLHYDKKSEEDFYRQFDGIKVLPVSLLDQYQHFIEKKQFIKADGLLVSIRESRAYVLLKDNGVYRQRICYALPDDSLAEKNVLVINRKYDSDIGLQMKVESASTSCYRQQQTTHLNCK